MISRAGYRVVLSGDEIETAEVSRSLSAAWSRQRRWAILRKRLGGPSYAAELLASPLPWFAGVLLAARNEPRLVGCAAALYLLRIGLSWLFLTFLSFLAFSAVVTALSTFFLSEDLRLLLTAPVPIRRLFHARFFRTLGQSSWMVVIFLAPVLMGIGRARCAGLSFYLTSALTTVPFAIIPVAAGTLA